MLQWVPGSKIQILYNDRQDGQFVAHIVDVKSGKRRTIPSPVYTLSPDGRWGIRCDFRHLHDCRPGWYAVGVWRVDLMSGKRQLLVSIADAQRIPYAPGYSNGAKHWFNHLLISPDGSRFIFLHPLAGR